MYTYTYKKSYIYIVICIQAYADMYNVHYIHINIICIYYVYI